jgi:hypothetical protein
MFGKRGISPLDLNESNQDPMRVTGMRWLHNRYGDILNDPDEPTRQPPWAKPTTAKGTTRGKSKGFGSKPDTGPMAPVRKFIGLNADAPSKGRGAKGFGKKVAAKGVRSASSRWGWKG